MVQERRHALRKRYGARTVRHNKRMVRLPTSASAGWRRWADQSGNTSNQRQWNRVVLRRTVGIKGNVNAGATAPRCRGVCFTGTWKSRAVREGVRNGVTACARRSHPYRVEPVVVPRNVQRVPAVLGSVQRVQDRIREHLYGK